MSKDLYKTLGVSRTASDADIKKAYRKLAKELHPDRNPGDVKIAERFKDISAAYTILSDSDKRKQYDSGAINADGQQQGFARGNPFGGDASDIFADIFGSAGARQGGADSGSAGGFNFEDLFSRGGRAQPPRRGADVVYRLTVPFIDAALALDQRLPLQNGKTIDLKLPKGLESGRQVKLKGQGKEGTGGPGDALITIDIEPHPIFERKGDDIHAGLPVSLTEAVAGASVRAPTPDGAVMVNVPAGSSSGRQLRLRGRGFTRATGERGDLILRLQVMIPEGDAELQRFVEGWEAGRSFKPRKQAGLE